MLFNSLEFLVFFPVVTALYFLLPHRFRWAHLLVASCAFYCAFIPVYLLILLFTIVIDYIAGIAIEGAQGRRRKLFLGLSIVANVSVLAVFKYYNFFIDNMNAALHALDISTSSIPALDIILPIGLSFHTFQAMSYTIEVYRGAQPAERHFGIYSLYVMFYPQLVAGPIERPQNLLHQFREKHSFNAELFMDGLRLMLWGFFKKVVIADRLAVFVNSVYDNPNEHNGLVLAIATIFFAIQIYCDFSGYSDIAIGAARTMGFNLMINFRRPYFATNIQEFWSRWHISLSTWFRDYLYIPLGGNRVSTGRLYLNVAVVFVVSGFWHGANWTFIVWGALHALFIVAYMIYRRYVPRPKERNRLLALPSMLVTFALVSFAWIFFRAPSLEHAWTIAGRIITLDMSVPTNLHVVGETVFGPLFFAFTLLLLVILFGVERFASADMASLRSKLSYDVALGALALTMILCFGVFNRSSFIYFQF